MTWLPRPIDLLNCSISLSGLEATPDVSYGAAPRDKIDFYRPKEGRNLPVIVFFYGGSWQWGHRRDYRFMAALLARLGFLVAVPDYRLYPDVKFPDFLQDCAAATAFVINRAADYAGNPREIFLIGHSAGAYNAVMLALNQDYLASQGCGTNRLSGVAGLSGPYDFLPIRAPDIKAIFSSAPDISLTQPVTFARDSAPPLFLAHGGADTTVLPRNTTKLAARLRAQGGIVETKIYPKLGHTGILLSALPYLSWRAPLLRDMMSFIAACRVGDLAGEGFERRESVVG